MRVKATKLGFYGTKRRNEGDEFDLDAQKDFSKEWMVEVKKPGRPKKEDSSES